MTNACPGTDLLLLLKECLIEDEDNARELDWHLSSCDRCQRRLELVEDSLAPPELPPLPKEVFSRLEKRIHHEGPKLNAAPALLGVKLLCSFCKGGLTRKDALYCSACLAPYHEDCRAEHGRCAVLGCEETEVVRSGAAPRRKGGGSVWGRAAVILALGAGSGLAAAFAWQMSASGIAAVDPEAPPPRTAKLEMRLESYDLSGLLPDASTPRSDRELSLAEAMAERAPELEEGWRRDLVQILRTRRISVNFNDTPFSDVVTFMQDITGLNIVTEADVTVSDLRSRISLKNTGLGEALLNMVEQAGLAMTLRNESLYLHKPRPRTWANDLGESLSELKAREAWSEEALLEAIRTRLEPPAPDSFLTIREGLLLARQPADVHERIPAILKALAAPQARGPERWFHALSRAPKDPSLVKIQGVVERLRARRVDLNFDAASAEEVVAFLRSLDPELPDLRFASPELAGREVRLTVRGMTVLNALALLAEQLGQSLDVDRRGILIRAPTAMPYERRLRERARSILASARNSSELKRRLDYQRVDLNFVGTPLAEVLDFLRAITGLNLVLNQTAEDLASSPINVKARSVTLRAALNLILKDLGLGLRFKNGVIHITKAGRADLFGPLETKVSALLERPWSRAGLGVDLAAFADQLRAATGSVVVFPEGLRGRRRIAIPTEATVGEALELCRLQAGLSWGLAWTEETRPMFALDSDASGLFDRAQEALEAAPASLRAEYPRSKQGIADGLAALAELDPTEGDRLLVLLEELESAVERAEDQRSFQKAATRAAARKASSEDSQPRLTIEAAILDCHRAMRKLGVELSALEKTTKDPAQRTRAEKVLKVEIAKRSSEAARLTDRAVEMQSDRFIAGEVLKKRGELESGQPWDASFPEGYSRWLSTSKSEAAERFYKEIKDRVERALTRPAGGEAKGK